LRSVILLVTIKPHSSLQPYFIGESINIYLNSYKELLDYLLVMQPKFMLYTKQLMSEGIQESFVFLDEALNELSSDDLFIKRFNRDTVVHIVPIVMGGGGKRGGFLALLASAALFFFAGPIGAAVQSTLPTAFIQAGVTGASVVSQLATGLAIAGLSALLMRSPVSKDSEKNRVENGMFSSLRNTVDSGTFVPINYGQVRVAGQLITGYIKTVNHPKGFNVKVSDVIGFNNTYYDSLLAAQSGFLPLPTSIKVLTREGLIMYIDAADKGSYPGSGNVITDLISGQQGVILGNVIFRDSTISYVSAFEFANGSIDMNSTYVSSEEINNANQTYTLETWVNLSNNISNTTVITNSAFGIAVDKEVITRFEFEDVITTVFPRFKSVNTSPIIDRRGIIDRWQHIALSITKSAARLYINGSFASTSSISTTISGASNVIIGSTQLKDSKLAIARIYNRTLTEEEIEKNFKAEKNRFGL